MKDITSYTCKLSAAQIKIVKRYLEERGFVFKDQPYAHFKAAHDKLNVVAYESGKLLVQGKRTREFVEFFLEPEVLGELSLGYEEIVNPETALERIGIDESGKGDYFGPLVVAGYYVPGPDAAGRLADIGVKDSKAIKSAANIKKIAAALRQVPGSVADSIIIGPAAYNRLYAKFRNLNRLLAWGHARCIENLLGAKNNCPLVIVDQFADKRLVSSALMEKGRKVELRQRHKAESDLAVAAASIIAREKFLLAMEKLSETYSMTIPRGASAHVRRAAREFVSTHGMERLGEVAKLHFRTTEEISQ